MLPSPNAWKASHMLRNFFPLVITATALAVGGCDRDGSAVGPGQPEGPERGPELNPSAVFPGLITDPAPASSAGALSGTGDADVVFLSIPPGVVADALSATITNYRTKRSITALVIEGGFDPVPIDARMTDTIFVTFELPNNGARQTWAVVPRTRRPAVVRIDPPSAGRDVPPAASMLIVFSEPIDAASVSSSIITLKRNDEVVPGTAEVLQEKPWLARFTPAAELANDATYELVASDQVRDLDGETLESLVRVNFTTVPVTAARIAFSRWSGITSTIYTMNPDGSRLAAITEGVDPSFSPDGKRIAFWRYDNGGGVIYVVNADGSKVPKVVSEGHHPTWSPDGSKLAYGCGGICIINVDGTGQTRLTPAAPTSQTPDVDVCVRDTDPTWSPDGSTIAFTRWPDVRIPGSMCLELGVAISFPFDFRTEVWFIDVDGGNLRPLRDSAGNATYGAWPAWSPDGKQLAFYGGDGYEERIDVVSADGSGVVTVVQRDPPQWDNVLGSPAWSPDGTRIVFGTSAGWGFAAASGSGDVELVNAPPGMAPSSLTWSWARH